MTCFRNWAIPGIFFSFFVFSMQLNKFVEVWIRTTDLWCWKQPTTTALQLKTCFWNWAIPGFFFSFLVFSILLIKFVDVWIRTTDLWCWKQPTTTALQLMTCFIIFLFPIISFFLSQPNSRLHWLKQVICEKSEH